MAMVYMWPPLYIMFDNLEQVIVMTTTTIMMMMMVVAAVAVAVVVVVVMMMIMIMMMMNLNDYKSDWYLAKHLHGWSLS